MGLIIIGLIIIVSLEACQPRTVGLPSGGLCTAYRDHMECVDKDGRPIPPPPHEEKHE